MVNRMKNRLTTFYNNFAVILLNIVVFLILANVFSYLALAVAAKFSNPVTDKYGEAIYRLYPELRPAEVDELLNETWKRSCVFESYVHFRERPGSGKFVNVDENGFRLTRNQGPWPIAPDNFNIFLFGGSTAFNYGVPDENTIASYLQENLSGKVQGKKVRVYNFGCGSYYSSQERILFEKLLLSGAVPDMAVFVDGLNDFYYEDDNPKFARLQKKLFEIETKSILSMLMRKMPVHEAVESSRKYVRDKLFPPSETASDEETENDPRSDEISRKVVARYVQNVKMIEAIASIYDVKPLFFWQPVPTYKYNPAGNPFADEPLERHSYTRKGYPYFENYLKTNPLGDNFVWGADIQENIPDVLYVDKVHYSSAMSKMIGDFIAEKVFQSCFTSSEDSRPTKATMSDPVQ